MWIRDAGGAGEEDSRKEAGGGGRENTREAFTFKYLESLIGIFVTSILYIIIVPATP